MDDKVLTPLKAIRKKCLECAGNSPKEVRLCQTQECPLYVYRLGKNFRRAGIGGKTSHSTSKVSTQVRVLERTKSQDSQVEAMPKEVKNSKTAVLEETCVDSIAK